MLWIKQIVFAFLFSAVVISSQNVTEDVTTEETRQSTTEGQRLTTTLDPDEEVMAKWKKLMADASSGVDALLRQILPLALSSDVDLNPECTSSIFQIILGLRSQKRWVFELIDATGKIESGILRGSVNSLGNYDQCVDLVVKGEYTDREEFRGQYCSIIIKLAIPPRSGLIDLDNFTDPSSVFRFISRNAFVQANTEFRFGVCLPSTCKKSDVTNIVSSVTQSYPFLGEVLHCETKRGWNVTWDQILTLFILSLLAIWLIASTIVTSRITEEDTHTLMIRMMDHFSLTKNVKKLFRMEKNHSSLACCNGIKVLSMMWIIVVHSYAIVPPSSYAVGIGILDMVHDRLFTPIANASLSVDAFFVLGGLMVSYLTLKYMDKSNGKVPLVGFIVRRLWRLLPGILVVLGGTMLLPLMGSGPVWEEVVMKEVQVCRRNWWATILLINSWFEYFEMCLVHTWYLSNDWHFFLLAPAILYVLYRKPIAGFTIVAIIVMAGSLTVWLLTYTRELHPSLLVSEGRNIKLKETMEAVYFKPYAHVGPYYLGFLLGFVLFKYRDIHLNVVQLVIGWCISSSIGLAVVYCPYDWYHGNLPSPMQSAFYQALHRFAFGLSICWVIFCCAYGYGGFLNTVLSWRGLSPLNRLTYLMYLVQMPVLWVKYGARRDTIVVHHRDVLYEILGNFAVITAISTFLYVTVEAPFASLDVEFFGKRMRAKRRPSEKRNVYIPKNPNVPTLIVTDENTPDKGVSNGGFVTEEGTQQPVVESVRREPVKTVTLSVVDLSDEKEDARSEKSGSADEDEMNNRLNAVFMDHTPVATPIGIRRAVRMGGDVNDVELTQPQKENTENEECRAVDSIYLSITNNYDDTPVATPIEVRKSSAKSLGTLTSGV